MEIGVTLPQFGRYASPEAITRLATEAEQMGYRSLWVSERVLWPLKPRSPYGGVAGARWPEVESTSFDPMETLAFVASITERIQLGTAVVDALLHVPAVLAKRFATVDQLSRGRVIAGLGQGWAIEEFETANVPYKRRGAGFEEFISALRACWETDPVKYSGRFYRITESIIQPKPVQPGGPPIIVGAYNPAAVARAGRIADGLTPIAASWEILEQSIHQFKDAALKAGRDPSGLAIIVCAASYSTWETADARPPLNGSLDQIRDDLGRMAALGVDHVYFGINYQDLPLEDQLRRMEELRTLFS